MEDAETMVDLADNWAELSMKDTAEDFKIVVNDFRDCNCDVCEDMDTILDKTGDELRTDECAVEEDKPDTNVIEDATVDLELSSETMSDDCTALALRED